MIAEIKKIFFLLLEKSENKNKEELWSNVPEHLINSVINKEAIHDFINTLEVSDSIKAELMQITPSNYVGI